MDASSEIIPIKAKDDIVVVNLTKENVEELAGFRDKGNIEIFRKYLAEGRYGVAAMAGSGMAGHAWAYVCRKNICQVDGYFSLRQREALIHDCHVKADQRGKNIYPALLINLCARLFLEAGVQRIFIDTETTNQASLRGIEKTGFKYAGEGIYVLFRGRLLFNFFYERQ